MEISFDSLLLKNFLFHLKNLAFLYDSVQPTMSTPRRTPKSQAVEKIQGGTQESRIRPPASSHPELSKLTAFMAGKRPLSTSSNGNARKKMRKPLHATSEIAQDLREVVRSSRAGLPPANTPSSALGPAVKVISYSLRGEHIDNYSSPLSTSRSTPFPSPSQSLDLGSVASFAGRSGSQSTLHSGSLELASVLKAVKRLLEQYCYRVSLFISHAEEMMDVSAE